jgi:glycerate 2-kinase
MAAHNRSAEQLRADALAIWQAGVEAVRSDRLVKEDCFLSGDRLIIGQAAQGEPIEIPVASIGRVAVVGAGKAGAGMAAGVEAALGPALLTQKQVAGWINVPADCVVSDLGPRTPDLGLARRIHLHAARPAGLNEPTAEGVLGAEKILDIVSHLGPSDLCLCLISGGGSALLPAPIPGVSLAEKQAITRHLSAAGANIAELNTVRKQLSRIKGGGLARACRAGRLITLIISDVLGDPLDVIASGPTVPDTSTPQQALAILDRFGCNSDNLRRVLNKAPSTTHQAPATAHVTNIIIGNNALAVDAAGIEAERRGYSHAMHSASKLEGPAEEIGHDLARMTQRMLAEPGPDCLITGGEPTVALAPPEIRGRGGRNQQLVLAALLELLPLSPSPPLPFVLLSAGTDGEDGPTDAAGAIIDADFLARLGASQLDPQDLLRRNDAYTLFDRLGGLIKTGPTHTNVCDLRVVVVSK